MRIIQQHTIVDTSFLYISDGSLLNDVPDEESLNRLILHNRRKQESDQTFNTNLASDQKRRSNQTLGQHFPQLEHLIGFT